MPICSKRSRFLSQSEIRVFRVLLIFWKPFWLAIENGPAIQLGLSSSVCLRTAGFRQNLFAQRSAAIAVSATQWLVRQGISRLKLRLDKWNPRFLTFRRPVFRFLSSRRHRLVNSQNRNVSKSRDNHSNESCGKSMRKERIKSRKP